MSSNDISKKNAKVAIDMLKTSKHTKKLKKSLYKFSLRNIQTYKQN